MSDPKRNALETLTTFLVDKIQAAAVDEEDKRHGDFKFWKQLVRDLRDPHTDASSYAKQLNPSWSAQDSIAYLKEMLDDNY